MRQKWHKIRVNYVVIVQNDIEPRKEWKLAKVTEVYPGEDGCVRKLQFLISDSALDDQGKRIIKPVYPIRPIQKTVTLLEA